MEVMNRPRLLCRDLALREELTLEGKKDVVLYTINLKSIFFRSLKVEAFADVGFNGERTILGHLA
jgi:hypothetical protein